MEKFKLFFLQILGFMSAHVFVHGCRINDLDMQISGAVLFVLGLSILILNWRIEKK